MFYYVDFLMQVFSPFQNPIVPSVVDINFKDDLKLSNCFAECEHENTVVSDRELKIYQTSLGI